MVARTPPKQQHKIRMVAPLNPILLRETVNKVDKCMARLQELQYTVSGGNKVVSGVTLSPRSTRGYLKTSLRCKQETLRNRNANNARRSPPGKLPTNTGDWKRMSLPAMLLGETVGEILQASQFTRGIVEAAEAPMKSKRSFSDDPRTPLTVRRNNNKKPSPEKSELRSRRKREKQIRSESDRTPSLQRAKSRINFKVSSPIQKKEIEKENCSYMANRVSPRNRPWAKKTVLFPNPLFHSLSPTKQVFPKTKSPMIAKKHQTPHKFLIKSPVKIKSPPLSSTSPTRATSVIKKSQNVVSTAAKLRRSFSPSRIANRLISPLKSRKSVQKSDEMMLNMMSGLKQRPNSVAPMRFSAPRI